MPRHRKRRRSKNIANRRRKRMLFAGASFLMLIAVMVLIVPMARGQNISLEAAAGLALLLWACSVFAVWACLRSRRRRSRDHHEHTTGTDYSDSLDDEYSIQPSPGDTP